MNKPILITGGAGFIGSHLVDLFESLGISYHIVDNLFSGSTQNITSTVSKGLFCKGDVKDNTLMAELIGKSSMVIHLASVVGVKHVIKKPLESIETNVNALNFIARTCAEYKIPLIFFSTSLVYPSNNGQKIFFTEEINTHGLGFHPVSMYVSSKRTGELICEFYKEQMNLKYIIIRPFNLIGIRQTSESGMVVPTFIKSALHNNSLNVYGSGLQTRSFSDVKQAVKLLWEIIQKKESYGQIFNLATTDKSISILDLARLVVKLVSEQVKINFISLKDVYGEAYVDVEFRTPSLTKLRQHLPYWRESDLENVISEILEYEKTVNSSH
jgi:UDP-glucose 4-epimerase